MNHSKPTTDAASDSSLTPAEGWHCSHLFYRFDRARLDALDVDQRREGCRQLIAAIDPDATHAPHRIQTSIVSGHKADFGLMLLDPDPLAIDTVHQRVLAGPLGPAIEPTFSYVSLTEVSEYVPTVDQYAGRLVAEGEEQGSPTYNAKVKAYEQREAQMRRQRLTPDLPSWPATCFYPMNKWRLPGANWYALDFDERNRMMTEHGRSGMAFAGKVTQLITVGIGLDDWEWGVTLWARNPEFLKEIVYRMRFDEASAKYAEFGPFFTSYVVSAAEMLEHCRVASDSYN
jgi:chlorite dismutase